MTRAQRDELVQYLAPRVAGGVPNAAGQPDASQLGELYLLPFTAQQREQYVARFARSELADAEWRGAPERYLRALGERDDLLALCTEPLTLFMMLRILPGLQVGLE